MAHKNLDQAAGGDCSMHTDSPISVGSIEWTQATGYARQFCAHVFRDGGSPASALQSHGIVAAVDADDWGKAVELIAETICAEAPLRQAA